MSRSTPEWIGKTDDTPIPKRVKLRILLAFAGRCHRTGHKFRPGDVIEYDHILALCNGGENRESNIGPILGGKVHKAKSAADVATKAKTARIYAKNNGLWPEPVRKIQSRPFPGRKAKAASALWRPSLAGSGRDQ